MKYWLNIPCKELSDKWLSDEHMSVHAYFGGMEKNPHKWVTHKLIGPMDAAILAERHKEQVEEMARRGWKHKTPVTQAQINIIAGFRVSLCSLGIGEMFVKDEIVCVEEMRVLQEDYAKVRGISLDWEG